MKKRLLRLFGLVMATVMVGTSADFSAFAMTDDSSQEVYYETMTEDSSQDDDSISEDDENDIDTVEANYVTVEKTDDDTFVTEDGATLSNPRNDGNGNVVWDCVYFGNYWQEDTNGDGKANTLDAKQPIKWRVLNVNGNDAFLLADMNLDRKKYNTSYIGVTWETCTLRSWLNGYGSSSNSYGTDYTSSNFMDTAFSSSEQSAIKITTVVNADNPVYDTKGGNNTQDKVYLLSLDEVKNGAYGFSTDWDKHDKARRAKNTAFVASYSGMNGAGSSDRWWLRSPGYNRGHAAYVYWYGPVNEYGPDVYDTNFAVRPALHLNLSSSTVWSYAGTVSSEGTVSEPGQADDIEPDYYTSMWEMVNGRPVAYLRNGERIKNQICELSYNDGDYTYFGKWKFDKDGNVVTGEVDDVYYNNDTTNGYPYGIALPNKYEDKLKQLRPSQIFASYNYVSTFVNDLDSAMMTMVGIDDWKKVVSTGLVAAYKTATRITSSLIGKNKYSQETFLESWANAYIDDEATCTALLKELVEQKFDPDSDYNKALEDIEKSEEEITKMDNELLKTTMKKVFKSNLESDLKEYNSQLKKGNVDKSKYTDDYVKILNEANDAKKGVKIASEMADTFFLAANTVNDVSLLFKNYTEEIEFLTKIRDNTAENNVLHKSAQRCIDDINARYFMTTYTVFVKWANLIGWDKLLKVDEDSVTSAPVLTGYLSDDYVAIYLAVTKWGFKLAGWGNPIGNAESFYDIVFGVSGANEYIDNIKAIIGSSNMRTAASRYLQIAEDNLIEQGFTKDNYENYLVMFELTKMLTLYQYENMQEFYESHAMKLALFNSCRENIELYCKSEKEKLQRINVSAYNIPANHTLESHWEYENGNTYYNFYGTRIKNCWMNIGGGKDPSNRTKIYRYYFDENGCMVTGFKNIVTYESDKCVTNTYYFSQGDNTCKADDPDIWPKGAMVYNYKNNILSAVYTVDIEEFERLYSMSLNDRSDVYVWFDSNGKLEKNTTEVVDELQYYIIDEFGRATYVRHNFKAETRRTGTFYKNNCPVNIEVYDESGELIASIIDDKVVKAGDGTVKAYIDGDGQKVIETPLDMVVNTVVTATDDGTYSVSIADNNVEESIYNRFEYKEIPIKKGDVITIDKLLDIDNDDNYLGNDYTVDNGEVIAPDDFRGTLRYSCVNIVDYDGVAKERYIESNDFIKISALDDREDFEFAGWYIENECVSTEPEFKICVTENVTLKAKYKCLKLDNPRINTDEDGRRSTKWDCVYFGNYYQSEYEPKNAPANPQDGMEYIDTDGTKYICVGYEDYRYYKYEPIKWRVLEVNDDEALLLAEECLDAKTYNESSTDVTWAESTIRSWLNGYDEDVNIYGKDYTDAGFIDIAFTQEEINAINETSLENKDFEVIYVPFDEDGNEDWDNSELRIRTTGGENTTDNVFLLSWDEITNKDYGFLDDIHQMFDSGRSGDDIGRYYYDCLPSNNDPKCAKVTAYAEANGAYSFDCDEAEYDAKYIGDGIWWLRSPGSYSDNASIVDYYGIVYRSGSNVDNTRNAVRPALHINLSSSTVWSYAGNVSSDPGFESTTTTTTAYTVTFKTNGGKCGEKSIIVTEGASYGRLPKPLFYGKCFIGWYTDSEDGTKVNSDDIVTITEDITLYAHWADSHGDKVPRGDVVATCVDSGYSGDYYCSVCGELLELGKVIPATGEHTIVAIKAVEATCIRNGSTEGNKCSVCGTVTVEPQTVSANGIHAWISNDEKSATCTEEGYEGGQHCANCSATQGEVKKLEKTDHSFDEGKIVKEPDYKNEGEKTFTCTVCNATKIEPIARLVEKGKEVEKTTEVKNDDGTVTIVEEHKDKTVTEKTDKEVTVGETKIQVQLVVDKDASKAVTGVEVRIEPTGKAKVSADLVTAVKEMVAVETGTTAKKANPEITLITNDTEGNAYSITASAKDLKKNAKLTVFAIDPVTGELILTDVGKLKCDRQGVLVIPALSGDKDYKLLSTKEASKVLKTIKKKIALSEKNGQADVGSTYIIKLADGYNPVNIKDIDYVISSKKGLVNKATGVVTLDPKVTKGTVLVKVTVTLTDGSKVKLSQKIKIKK